MLAPEHRYVLAIPVSSDEETINTIGPRSYMDVWRDVVERGLTGLKQFRTKRVPLVNLITFDYAPQCQEGEADFLTKVKACIQSVFHTTQAFLKLQEIHFCQTEVCLKGKNRLVYRVKVQLHNNSGLVEEILDRLCQELSQVEGLRLVGKYPKALSLSVNLYDSNVGAAASDMTRKRAVDLLKRLLAFRSLYPRDEFGTQFITEMRLYRKAQTVLVHKYHFCPMFHNSFVKDGGRPQDSDDED